jgi:hypothetical protein
MDAKEIKPMVDGLWSERDALRARLAELEAFKIAVAALYEEHKDCSKDDDCCLASDLRDLLNP